MKAASLMDVIAPPGNLWLQELLQGRAGALPPGVRVIRFEVADEPDEATPRRSRHETSATAEA